MSYKAIQVGAARGDFETVERKITEPAPGQVLIRVEACGVCHGDVHLKEGHFPGVQYPRVPGHEIIGCIEKLGENVTNFEVGQRVGLGWHGGHCGTCNICARGHFIVCPKHKVTGFASDGGYAQYCIATTDCLARVPEELKSEEAAPLMCAGVSVYNSLRNTSAKPGDLVAVQGVGGLGHLGIQYANKMGFKVAAISTSSDKKDFATQLGAHIFLDSSKQNVVAELQKLGGAKVIMCTANDSKAMSALIDGVGVDGVLLILGASPQPLSISPLQLISSRRSIQGWPSGSPIDSQEALNFAALHNIKAQVETFPLSKTTEAYNKMLNNQARFRAVILPQQE